MEAREELQEQESVEEPDAASEPPEYAEQLAWSRALADELAQYRGEFVALADARIVAHNADFLALMAEVERLGIDQPYIVSVPSADAGAQRDEKELKAGTNVVNPVEMEDGPLEHVAEMTWLDAHGEELARYAGQWVALSAGKIIAHDPSLATVMNAAREQGIERPFLIPVPPEGVLIP